MQVSRRIVLHFPASLTGQPIVYRLARDYGLEFNIIKASVSPEEEGLMVLEVRGDEQGVEAGMKYLSEKGVMIEPFNQRVVLREERCIHCGLCVGLCPVGAFRMEPGTYYIRFEEERCLACGLCIKACPPRAMEVGL